MKKRKRRNENDINQLIEVNDVFCRQINGLFRAFKRQGNGADTQLPGPECNSCEECMNIYGAKFCI